MFTPAVILVRTSLVTSPKGFNKKSGLTESNPLSPCHPYKTLLSCKLNQFYEHFSLTESNFLTLCFKAISLPILQQVPYKDDKLVRDTFNI
jgi:hypothetical protein